MCWDNMKYDLMELNEYLKRYSEKNNNSNVSLKVSDIAANVENPLVKPKRKRKPMSDERRSKLAEFLKKARSAKLNKRA